MSQTQKIYEYMQKHGSITALDAVRDLHCMRLAARIADLKAAGIAVRAATEETIRDGEKVRYARYSIVNAD